MNYTREFRFHAPLSEKNDDELLIAVRKNWQDADAARAELHRRGWKDEWITS